MNCVRKEHSSVRVGDFIYTMGGYDQLQKIMLKKCERYNILKDEWELLPDLNESKCAFGAAADEEGFIYIFGGFDGKERLRSIEKYDPIKK